MAQDTPLTASAISDAEAVADAFSDLQIQATPNLPWIEQSSIFSVLPSELVLEIFSYLDILTIFEFLDTCRYHRYMLLNLPEIWRKVRFIPLSELITLQQQSSTTSAVSPSASTTTSVPTAFAAKQRSENNTEAVTSEAAKPSHRLKHAENERDRERGGSRSLISEIYAVLRRFRKDNRLVDFVREIYMDSTDSPHFPSPLVMLIKFPHLEILSSRYRRGQTSLNTDTHTLKDMLRNGDIGEHSLKLRRWDIFHPYMTNEDVVGFKAILDAIALVGQEANGPGVILDIKPCPGPLEGASVEAPTTPGATVHHGLHWASSITSATTPTAVPATTPPSAMANEQDAITSQSSLPPTTECSNLVWKLEKCRICLAPQDRCWKCVTHCGACRAARAPPHINHQTALERERAARLPNKQNAVTVAGVVAPASTGRPVTPPGSISLSQMSNSSASIPSAYLSLGGAGMASLTSAMIATSSPAAHMPVALPVPPEFSFFD
ncbi:hypothetical protein EMPS_07253 [Entomortierella parvispora]|uniref:F-box domain-containing protein n=1 Tax=Entomortierella parvispora TaxID=205924 RepID=A0A9P3HDT4_9FUNG|nr:hypothetical protein EMPS_07253 [Entomortierella parvispora]